MTAVQLKEMGRLTQRCSIGVGPPSLRLRLPKTFFRLLYRPSRVLFRLYLLHRELGKPTHGRIQ